MKPEKIAPGWYEMGAWRISRVRTRGFHNSTSLKWFWFAVPALDSKAHPEGSLDPFRTLKAAVEAVEKRDGRD